MINRRQLRLALLCLATTTFVGLLVSTAIKTNNPANPWVLTKSTEVGGPFESSNTTSRIALVEAIVNQQRFSFTLEQARFAVPDAVEKNGVFYSSFTPGISMVAVPFYVLGKDILHSPELAVFLSTICFAILNGWLIYFLAKRLGASTPAAMISSLIFLFSTNALVYTGTLTQHHGSTAILLAAILNALQPRTWWRNLFFGVLCGIGFLFDFPNLFMLFPVGIYILYQHLSIKQTVNQLQVNFKLSWVMIAIGLAPLLALFGWYNIQLSGSPLGFAQFQVRSNYFDTDAKKAADQQASLQVDEFASTLPFNTRLQLQGTYILGLSNERSWLWYSPVVLLGAVGLYFAYRQQPSAAVLVISVISINFLLYSMFGDPWGGWSFGPRYLIPGAALMSAAISLALTQYRRNIIFLLVFGGLCIYSTSISLAGALTTATIPPKGESQALINYVPYTYEYNFNHLEANDSNSLVYQAWFKEYLTAYQFYYILLSILAGINLVLLITNAKPAGNKS